MLPLRLLSLTFLVARTLVFPDGSGSDDDDDDGDGGSEDACGDDRGDGNLGDVCREDCDCAVDYSCFTDDYDEQCCAEQLNDLENGAWGVDCDGVQGPPAP